jgi:hypothetical protein
MNTKSSKKIVPATVFATIIVLLTFAVMSTTVSANGLSKTLDPTEGGLGTEVTVIIDVTVGASNLPHHHQLRSGPSNLCDRV